MTDRETEGQTRVVLVAAPGPELSPRHTHAEVTRLGRGAEEIQSAKGQHAAQRNVLRTYGFEEIRQRCREHNMEQGFAHSTRNPVSTAQVHLRGTETGHQNSSDKRGAGKGEAVLGCSRTRD